MLTHAAEIKAFAFHPGCTVIKQRHLSFADDLTVFRKADESSLKCMEDIFHKFCNIFGLSINETKSQIAIAGVMDDRKASPIRLAGFVE